MTQKLSHSKTQKGLSKDLNRVINPDKTVLSTELVSSIQSKFQKNYFGLPPYSLQQNPGALAYQSRKQLVTDSFYETENHASHHHTDNEKNDLSSRRNQESASDLKVESNYTAQRKVANALLTMVRNEIMMKHFLNKGGLEAVLKLVGESKDAEVLNTCAKSLIQASVHVENCRALIDKNIFGAIATLIEVNDEQMRHMTSTILGNLSTAKDSESLLAFNNILQLVQNMFSHVHRTDTLCFLMLTLSNVSPAYSVQEAELTARLCSQITKKIDIVRFVQKASFIADVYNNFSRVSQYSSLLVEEGVLPLLLHLMDSHPTVEDILRKCTEALSNLSNNRKNRREIASSGIASRLNPIFEHGSNFTRANLLLLMGNLLSSGMFHDKVANEATISNILDNLLDTKFPKQFNAVSYCLCQLSKNETSCATMVTCSVIPIVLGYLRVAPKESVDYLWIVLVNISQFPAFYEAIIGQIHPLISELYEEVKYDASSQVQQKAVVQIAMNISRRSDLSSYMDSELIQLYVKTMKILFASRLGTPEIQIQALITLINFAYFCKESRVAILGNDLIDLFAEVGVDDDKMNVKYAGLINIISNEEPCCYKLLELGCQKFLVTLQDSFIRLTTGSVHDKKKARRYKKGQSMANLNAMMRQSGMMQDLSQTSTEQKVLDTHYEYDALAEGELGKSLTAATLHNLAIKRPILSPGVLQAIITLSKNCKTLRVLHCVRTLASMSAHPKSKVDLSKKSAEIIPLLTVIMRCGCEEAEKVQHYCAIILCNLLATPLDKTVLFKLIKDKEISAVTDLVVVTLLRINSTLTKEMLGKAFFNLLIRYEIRETLVVQLDMLAAIIELSKIENVELLELCMRALYNVTCELKSGSGVDVAYGNKLLALKVPQLMMARLKHKPDTKFMPGSQTTKQIRFLLGMSIANMSFNKQLVIELTSDTGLIADALYRVFMLNSEEATYCACVTLYNLSQIPECRVLVDSKALQLIVEVQAQECSIVNAKLCIATLCNFSMKAEFHEQMSAKVMTSIIKILASPQLHMSIKMDAIQAVYNLVTLYVPSRVPFIENDGVIALWKLLKTQGNAVNAINANNARDEKQDDNSSVNTGNEASIPDSEEAEESTLLIIGHIVKELCEDMTDVKIQKKAMADGIMNIILKLAKIESPILKLDMSFCIYALTKGPELMKVLKWDSVDILFWLTIYDTMGMHDLILRNVSRALRSFTSSVDECKILLKQDRFFPVLKALIKSKNEDVLWQTSGVIYNLMHVDACLKLLLTKGLVNYIFEIAACGFESVKHVCSACLHMIPENMPNMDDPLVLELVLCLLEAQGDKFSEISDRPIDVLPYNLVEPAYGGSLFKHRKTDFKASWSILTCTVDSIFSPALIFTPSETSGEMEIKNLDGSSISAPETHAKIRSAQYREFSKDSHIGSVDMTDSNWAMLPQMSSSQLSTGGVSNNPLQAALSNARMNAEGGGLSVSVSTPQLHAKAPHHLDGHHIDSHSHVQFASEDDNSLHSNSNTNKHLKSEKTAPTKSSSRMSTNNGGSAKNSPHAQPLPTPQNYAATAFLPPPAKLPLIPVPQKIPENTLDVINQSIRKASFKKNNSSSHSNSALSLTNEGNYSMDFEDAGLIGGDIGEHAFSVSSVGPGGGGGLNKKGSHPSGLSSSVLKSSGSFISVNNHGNMTR